MKTHLSPEVAHLQERFQALQADVDSTFGPEPVYGGNDRSQIYKALLKTAIVLDGSLVSVATKLASDAFPEGGLAQVYPMLHLPQDTSERGNWHRDDNTSDRMVFWIPITRYEYPALSVVPNSEGFLSMPLSMAGSRGIPLVGFQKQLAIEPNAFYSWSSRLVHRGNLNTSDRAGAAFVIFLDRGKTARHLELADISQATLRNWGQTVREAVDFDQSGNVRKVDEALRSRLPHNVAAQINAFYKLRTKRDLLSAA